MRLPPGAGVQDISMPNKYTPFGGMGAKQSASAPRLAFYFDPGSCAHTT